MHNQAIDSLNTAKQVITLTSKVRSLQKAYFLHRDSHTLNLCKRKEKELDHLLAHTLIAMEVLDLLINREIDQDNQLPNTDTKTSRQIADEFEIEAAIQANQVHKEN